jgi:hypothetical protein
MPLSTCAADENHGSILPGAEALAHDIRRDTHNLGGRLPDSPDSGTGRDGPGQQGCFVFAIGPAGSIFIPLDSHRLRSFDSDADPAPPDLDNADHDPVADVNRLTKFS